ncbi:MAG: FAD:protein FMN transferase [Acidimicrobiales bacterium]
MRTSVEPLIETRFRAMGTDVHVALVGGAPNLLHVAEQRVRDLEHRWSRFLDDSEISALNRNPGRPVVVSSDTFTLVTRAVAAWHATTGRFDPTVGPALAAHGYDCDFTDVACAISPAAVAIEPAPGPADIDLIAGCNAVTLPDGVTVDPGGIGKGLAADLTAQLLLASGADGALVNLGGDLRAIGRAPIPDGWAVTVDDPIRPGHELLRLAMPEGAVATSSRLLRRWQTTAGEAHHLIDPTTGCPAQTEVVAVTVVAGEAWWAEALTKALFLTGPAGLHEIDDLHAVVVTSDGIRHATPDLEATLQ